MDTGPGDSWTIRISPPVRGTGIVGQSLASLLHHAWSGSRGVDAVVTALVLAASGASVSAPTDDRPCSSAMSGLRACGEQRVRGHARVQDLLFLHGHRADEVRGWVRPIRVALRRPSTELPGPLMNAERSSGRAHADARAPRSNGARGFSRVPLPDVLATVPMYESDVAGGGLATGALGGAGAQRGGPGFGIVVALGGRPGGRRRSPVGNRE
jgi:hypothetical protein